jgi:hypothetical protein
MWTLRHAVIHFLRAGCRTFYVVERTHAWDLSELHLRALLDLEIFCELANRKKCGDSVSQ